MKGKVLRYTIDNVIEKMEKQVSIKHEKKMQALKREKSTIDGLTPNPNVIVTNLSDRTLSNDEYEILAYGLNHGLHKRPKENDVLASSESVFKQLTKLNVLKENRYSIERVKVTLKAFSFSLLDLEDCRIFKDERSIKFENRGNHLRTRQR